MTKKQAVFPWTLQLPIYATGFFNGTVQTMATTIVALLLVAVINPELTLLIGLIIASRQFLTVTMSIHGGALMDLYGTKKVIILFGFLGVASALSFPLSIDIFNVNLDVAMESPPWVFIAMLIVLQMLSGFAEATGWIGSQTLVGKLMKGQPIYAGRMTFSARIGGFVGPISVGAAWDEFGPWGGFGFLAGWILCGIIAAAFIPAAKQRPNDTNAPDNLINENNEFNRGNYKSTFQLLLIPAVAMVIMVTMMRQTGSGVQTSFYVIWLREEIQLSGSLIGLLIGCANATSALAALSVGGLTKVIKDHWLLIITIAISIIFIAVTPILGDLFPLLLIAICCRGIGQGLNLPLMMLILSRNVGSSFQGRVTAMRVSFNRFGGMCVPPIMGGLAQLFGLANSFYIVGIFGVVALICLSIWVSRSEKINE